MKNFFNCLRLLVFLPIVSVLFFKRSYHEVPNQLTIHFANKELFEGLENDEEEENESAADYTRERQLHEFRMLRNPITGAIPENAHEMEMKAARAIPSRFVDFDNTVSRVFDNQRVQAQNNYLSIGPNNAGGRSRTLAFDRRNTSIMLTGGVTGGIFRSADGGQSWTFVSPENDIRSVTSIVQDVANPNVWYCGTGEVYNIYSIQNIANGPYGHGIFKSTDNGISWTKLASTADADPNAFNGQFDLVHKLAVHPVTSNVYAAVHNRILRSSNGGISWTTVLLGAAGTTGIGGLTDVVITADGAKIFAAFSGSNANRAVAGVWESSTGDSLSWRRIAGGSAGQADSVATWLPYGKWSRVVLALAPTRKLFVLYKNDKDASASTPLPEADLFRCDFSSGNPVTYTWQNLNAYVPNEPGGKISQVNPYTTQFDGFNMSLAVKPDNETILFMGGTTLERIDLTQTDPAKKFRRMGGYQIGFFPGVTDYAPYPNHHPDIHGIYFKGNDSLYTVSDGGVHKTVTSSLADTVRWLPLNNGLQTLQYQFVNIIPDKDFYWVIGGAQDNGTYYNLNAPTFLNQEQIGSGDGASAAMTGFVKNGNNWKQYWYYSIVQGALKRVNLTWVYDPSTNNLNGTGGSINDISPVGLSKSGQWLTQILNDPDSMEHLYYNNHNKLYRTTTASTIDSTRWTELTGVGNTLATNTNLSAMAISKQRNGTKYLFIGTETGKIYRLDNPQSSAPTVNPVNITPSSMAANSYVSGISVNPRNADTILAVVSNYDATGAVVNNIFWTGNATVASPTWQVLDGALAPVSSQSCAIIVKTSGVEYYVGTSVGLYSTTSINGANTTWLNEGSGMMKTAIIRSLVNRQVDNTLVVGTHGNGEFMAQIGNAVVITPDVTTGVDVIRNDKNFIQLVYPTITRGDIYFRTGQLTSVTRINCKVMSTNGQVLSDVNMPYSDGFLHVNRLPAGNYILMITSSDSRYQHITRFNKN